MRTDELEKLVRISVCADGLSATLAVQAGVDLTDVSADTVAALLEGRGIRVPSKLDESVEALKQQIAKHPDEEAEIVIARGVAPVHGKDGAFELDPSLSEEEGAKQRAECEDDADHYDRSAFVIVEEGQRVGRLLPHTEAEDGLDVRGKTIKAIPGRPCKIKFDETLRVSADGDIDALEYGRLEITVDRIRVQPVLVVSESVDFSTGNVDFPKDVLVQKGVRDCFTVQAGGSLEIVELVEAATVRAEGSILLRRGMAGRGKGEISTGADLETKYLDAVEVSVQNDLRIQRELTNCKTYVGRCIQSPTCSVVGGQLDVRFGGEVRNLGGEAEGETLVRIGIDPQLDEQAKELDELVPRVISHVSQATLELDQLRKMATKLTATQAESMTSLQFEIMTGQTRLASIAAGLQRMLEAYEQLSRCTLLVEKSIMPGVTIVIGGKAAVVREMVRGPVEIVLSESGTLMLRQPGGDSSMPLSAKAKLVPAKGVADIAELGRILENPIFKDVKAAA